ncbi:sodium:alanine symporter family protein [uncultured Sphaerochaeta sp.]|uniref:alanine/glycine:cation symporter family protein n=1 Tax=uncultured Sphaerochaeta sp. TaxID=886478 RepID=UPI002A0A475B|nr:sodium:alanine symporter family protein [uncultured Sphaerochaeta sp.]
MEFFDAFFRGLNWLIGQLWGIPMMVLLIGTGLYLTIITKFFQFRRLGYILRNTFGKIFEKENKTLAGVMTPFQAVSTALAGTVGTANIAGVAAAIAIGGPGALFWMWIVALVGMMTKMVEISLAVHFREVRDDGTVYGGPMFYLSKGLGKVGKPLAILHAVAVLIGGLVTAALLQPHTAAAALEGSLGINPTLSAVVFAVLTGLVIIGGFRAIGKFCERLVPFMAVLYALGALIIIIINFTAIPHAFGLIFRYAFAPAPAIGGFAGASFAMALQKGMARGMFSNEAGMGSAPMVHATAKTDHPIRQGLWGTFEVFVDTIILCSLTGLAILTTGVWDSGLSGINLTIRAFEVGLPGNVASFLVMTGIVLFAFSTQVGWYVNYQTAVHYLFGDKGVKYLKWIYLIPGVIFAGQGANAVWLFGDLACGIMGIPNLIGLILLSKVFIELYRDFIKKEGLDGKHLKAIKGER